MERSSAYYFPQEKLGLEPERGKLIAHLLGTNASMRITGSARKARVGGSPGMITPLTNESPYGGTEVDNW